MSMYRTARRQAGRGRPHRRIGLCAAATALAVTLAACGDSDDSSNSTAGFMGTLDRILATESTTRYIEYGHANLINEASGGSFQGTWGSLDGWGQSQVFPYRNQMPLVLGIDVTEADSVITVGQQPDGVTLIQGGQVTEEITSAATSSGWSDGDVLIWESQLTPPTGTTSPQVKPLSSDVALGGIEADMSVIDSAGTSLADDPLVSDLTGCLGEVMAALLVTDERAPLPVAVGVRRDDESPDVPVSVMCVKADTVSAAQALVATVEDAVSTGKVPERDDTYATLFESAEVETLEDGAITRMTADNTPEAFAHTIFQMTLAGRLPGVSLPRQAEA